MPNTHTAKPENKVGSRKILLFLKFTRNLSQIKSNQQTLISAFTFGNQIGAEPNENPQQTPNKWLLWIVLEN